VIEGDRLIARGATDDKGQSFAHLMAVAAMLEERGELPVNVKFILEGEEESGGSALETFVREDAGRLLACDAVVVSDGAMAGPGQPSLLYGIRGVVCAEITVTGPDHDLHSGSYGGAVANPLNALCRIVAELQDPRTRRVTIPGFYDAVRPLDAMECEALAELPFDAEAYARDAGVGELVGEVGFSTFERAWARPTLDVNGIRGGYQGEGSKTVIPSVASAKVSMRLVPDQDPEEVAEALSLYVRDLAPPGVRVEVERQACAPALRIDLDHPVMEAAATALEEVWGRAPLRIRDGGSLPILTTFTRVLGVPIVLAGFGLPDDRPHAPNERLDLRQFDLGTRTAARLLDLVAGIDPAPSR
jgi:acetylornithine deacetylase/succinyl-diaminopimelate desuccinylase-like protein